MRISAVRVLKTGAVAVLTALAGCGGSGGSGGTIYTIGGTVMGLKSGEAVVITDGAGSLSENTNGAFTFPGANNGAGYAVTIQTNPTTQSCGVLAGTGTIDAANVSGIDVYCTDNISASALDGTYQIAAFNINSDTDQLYTSVPFNGNGTQGASTVITNQAGTTFTTSTDPGGPYSVTTTDALPVLTVGNSAGAIAGADGDEFYWVANDLSGGGPPELVLGVNPLQTATINSLAGTWITVGLTQAPTPYDSEGSIAINDDGSFSGSQSTLDITGAANTQTVSGGAGSYTVTNTVVSTGADSGYISANGKFLLLAAVTQQAGTAYPNLTAAVQPGSGMTVASLSGVYSIGGLGYATASTGDGDSFTLYFDGAGNFSGTASQNDNGTYSSADVSGTYAVSSGGILTLTDSSGHVYTGGVSVDGNSIVAAYLTASGSIPEILVGFRQ